MTMLGSSTMVHRWRRRPDGSHDLLTHHEKDATYSEEAQVILDIFEHLLLSYHTVPAFSV